MVKDMKKCPHLKEKNQFRENLVKALLPHIVLSNAPIHGYALIRHIRKAYGVYLGASTIYPILADLEKNGLLQSQWRTDTERPHKTYTPTSAGRELLNETTTTLALLEVKTT